MSLLCKLGSHKIVPIKDPTDTFIWNYKPDQLNCARCKKTMAEIKSCVKKEDDHMRKFHCEECRKYLEKGALKPNHI